MFPQQIYCINLKGTVSASSLFSFRQLATCSSRPPRRGGGVRSRASSTPNCILEWKIRYTELPIVQLEENKGQIDGLPANPRNIQTDKLAKLKRSILDNPEMLQLRGILVYPHGDKYIVIGGNMRLRAMAELGMTSAPCVVIPSHVTADKLTAKSQPPRWAVVCFFVHL